jgi:thiol-disulfide isomerase/thioredoxin
MRPVWAEPGQKAIVRGDNNLIMTWSVKSPIPEQQEMEYYIQGLKTEYDEVQRNGMEMNALRASGDRSEEAKQRAAELETLERELEYRLFDKELDLMAAAEPGAVFMDELRAISGMSFYFEPLAPLKERAIAQYNRLTDEQKASLTGQEIGRFLDPPKTVAIGDPMADAELADLSGTMHKLSDYKGKYILLDFWASWCGPCRAAMPELAEISKQYADRLTVIGINSDESHDIWVKASEEFGVTWVNLNAPGSSEIAAKYKVDGIPHQVVISPEGVVLGIWAGYGKGHLREQLKKYIPEIE